MRYPHRRSADRRRLKCWRERRNTEALNFPTSQMVGVLQMPSCACSISCSNTYTPCLIFYTQTQIVKLRRFLFFKRIKLIKYIRVIKTTVFLLPAMIQTVEILHGLDSLWKCHLPQLQERSYLCYFPILCHTLSYIHVLLKPLIMF